VSYRDYCPECGKTCDYAYIYNDTHGIVAGCDNCIEEVDEPNTPCSECGDESEFCIYKRNGQVIGCDACINKAKAQHKEIFEEPYFPTLYLTRL